MNAQSAASSANPTPMDHKLPPSDCGTSLQALICPCVTYGQTIALLHNEDNMDKGACCAWSTLFGTGILGAAIGVPALTPLQPVASQLFYAFICMGYYAPHLLWGIPLGAAIKQKDSGSNDSFDYCNSKVFFDTLYCPCCELGSYKIWANTNKGGIYLTNNGACICPPMSFGNPPSQFSMASQQYY